MVIEKAKNLCPIFSNPEGASIEQPLMLDGRVSMGSVAGTAKELDATYTYGQLWEMRAKVTSWTGIGTSLSGWYWRVEAGVASTSQGIKVHEIYAMANATFGVSNLQGIYVEAGMKAGGTQTIANCAAIEASLAPYTGTGAITITNHWECLLLTPSACSSRLDSTNAAKIHGVYLLARDGDGASTRLGYGIYMANDTGQSGTRSLTSAIEIGIGCGTVLNVSAAAAALTTRGIFIGADSDSAQSGIPLLGADWATSQGNALYCDDDGVALTGYTEALTVRMLTTATVSSGDVSTVAIHPDLTLNASYTGTGGLSAIWANTTIKASKTINLNGSLGDVGGGTFGLDLNGTLAANSHGCGCSVGIGGSGTNSGIISAYRIRAATGTVDWNAVLSIEDGDGSWTSLTTTAASNTATMTNSPKSGNPAYWLSVYIAQTKYCFPIWLSA